MLSTHSQDEQILELVPRLRRYARALTGDPDRADDLVQDCLARGLSRMRLWRKGSDLRAWLFTIMHNIFVSDLRRLGRSPPTLSLAEVDEPQGRPAEPDRELEMRDLEEALGQLPPEQREVLLLVSLEGMRYQEVAALLKIPVGTVMSRLHRARERLRRTLNDESGPRLRSVK